MKLQRYWPLIPAFILWLAATILGLVPPFSRDALNDHMMLPFLWDQHGLFWRSPQLVFTAFPPIADIPYMFFAHQKWEWAASTWHSLGALVTLIFLDRTMQNLSASHSSRAWAAMIWISMPTVLSLCGWEYVDLWLCATAAGIGAVLSKSDFGAKDAWLLGLLSGIAILIKYNGIPLIIGAGIALLWRCANPPPRTILAHAARMLCATGLIAGWWYYHNMIILGNPLYPLGSDTGHAIPWIQQRIVAYHENAFWALAAPIRAFFSGMINNPQLFDGMLNPLLLLAFPALWHFRHNNRLTALGITFVCYFIFTLSTGVRARYILPSTVFMAPLALLYLAQLGATLRNLLPTIAICLTLLPTVSYFYHLSPWQFWSQGRNAFLSQQLPDFPMQRWIAEHIPQHATIHLLWMGGRAYYLNHPYTSDFLHHDMNIRELIADKSAFSQDYILMRRDLADQTLGRELGEDWTRFIAQSCSVATLGNYELRGLSPCK